MHFNGARCIATMRRGDDWWLHCNETEPGAGLPVAAVQGDRD
jgi:hypothetical protein